MPEPVRSAESDAGCERYDGPGQNCFTAGPQVIAAEGVCGPCAMRLLASVVALRPGVIQRERPERAWSQDRLAGMPSARPIVVTPERCPNDHGPDGVIACWSPGGPCPSGRTGCEMCGPCQTCPTSPGQEPFRKVPECVGCPGLSDASQDSEGPWHSDNCPLHTTVTAPGVPDGS